MPSHPNAGEDILAMPLLAILVPIGAIIGCIRAVAIFDKDNLEPDQRRERNLVRPLATIN